MDILRRDAEQIAPVVAALFLEDSPEEAAEVLRAAAPALNMDHDKLVLFIANHIVRAERILRVLVPEAHARTLIS